jgi:hypothetical protein
MLDDFTLGMASSVWFVVYVFVGSLQPVTMRQVAVTVKASSCPKLRHH